MLTEGLVLTEPRRHWDSRTAPQQPKKPTSITRLPATIRMYTPERRSNGPKWKGTTVLGICWPGRLASDDPLHYKAQGGSIELIQYKSSQSTKCEKSIFFSLFKEPDALWISSCLMAHSGIAGRVLSSPHVGSPELPLNCSLGTERSAGRMRAHDSSYKAHPLPLVGPVARQRHCTVQALYPPGRDVLRCGFWLDRKIHTRTRDARLNNNPVRCKLKMMSSV